MKTQKREEDYVELKADEGAISDEVIEIVAVATTVFLLKARFQAKYG